MKALHVFSGLSMTASLLATLVVGGMVYASGSGTCHTKMVTGTLNNANVTVTCEGDCLEPNDPCSPYAVVFNWGNGDVDYQHSCACVDSNGDAYSMETATGYACELEFTVTEENGGGVSLSANCSNVDCPGTCAVKFNMPNPPAYTATCLCR